MEAAQALADLTEISSQIESAVLAGADGSVAASTYGDDERASSVAQAALELLREAEQGRAEGSAGLVQLQAATPEGCVFVVRDGAHVVAAVTGCGPDRGPRVLRPEDVPAPRRRGGAEEAGSAAAQEGGAKKAAKSEPASSGEIRAQDGREERGDGWRRRRVAAALVAVGSVAGAVVWRRRSGRRLRARRPLLRRRLDGLARGGLAGGRAPAPARATGPVPRADRGSR